MDNELLSRITVIPGLMGGKPTIRAMRFPAGDVLEMIANGMSVPEILEQHPILEEKDIKACLLYASLRLNNTVVINAA